MNVYSSFRPAPVYPNTSPVLKPTSKRNNSIPQPLGENRSYHNIATQGHASHLYGSHSSKPSTPAYVSKPPLPTRVRQEVRTTENARPAYPHGAQSTLYIKEETYHYENTPSSMGCLEDDVEIPPPPSLQARPARYTHSYTPSYATASYSSSTYAPGYNHHYSYPQAHYRHTSRLAVPSGDCQPRDFPTAVVPTRSHSQPHDTPRASASTHCYHEQEPVAATSPPKPAHSNGSLGQLDIVVGRGAPTNFHYGNQVFKELVEGYQTQYLCAKRCDKPKIAMKIYDLVKESGARFMKRDKTSGRFCWAEIDRKGAYEKICQALREGAPDLRRRVLASAAKKESQKAK